MTADPTMDEITAAVALGHSGDTTTARTSLNHLWDRIGPAGDPFHRCVLAHYLADLYDDPAQALVWDVRAIDAAASVTDDRVRGHHDSLRVEGFYPSLHLNLADNFRRLGSFDAANDHVAAARDRQHVLGDDPYGAMIRQAIGEVADAIAAGSTDRRPTAPTAS